MVFPPASGICLGPVWGRSSRVLEIIGRELKDMTLGVSWADCNPSLANDFRECCVDRHIGVRNNRVEGREFALVPCVGQGPAFCGCGVRTGRLRGLAGSTGGGWQARFSMVPDTRGRKTVGWTPLWGPWSLSPGQAILASPEAGDVARYTLELIEQLARQLFLSPLRLRLQQIEGAEYLVDIIEPRRAYPYHLVLFHITSYRPKAASDDDDLLPGDCLISDLVQLIDELSASANLHVNQLGQMCWSYEDICGRFRVSPKTIKRWHQRGLVSYRAVDTDGQRKVVFPDRALRRFISKNARMVKRAASFSKLTEAERETIVDKARVLVERGSTKISDVAEQVAAEVGRSSETVRYILRRYDEHHPETALFTRQSQPIGDDEQLDIYRCYKSGDTIADLAKRFDRTVSSIHRIVTELKARELLSRSIEFIPSDEFESPDADEVILHQTEPSREAVGESSSRPAVPGDMPAYLSELYGMPLLDEQQEQDLFRRYNYIKYKAAKLAGTIDPKHPRIRDLEELEELYRRADQLKNRLIQANLRLVVSIAKRHLRNGMDLFAVISDGNLSLMRAVEKFDYTRGNKFSTYASWAIMKNFARTIPEERYLLVRYQTGHDERLEVEPDPEDRVASTDRRLTGVREALDRVLSELPARERSIVTHHYGLTPDGKSHTLDQIGELLGVSKERARQIEKRALRRLRQALSPTMLEAVLA